MKIGSLVTTMRYVGRDRRRSTPDERKRWAEENPPHEDAGTGKVVWWLMGILASLVVAVASGLAGRAMDAASGHAAAAPTFQTATSAEDMRDQRRRVDELQERLAGHVASSDANVAEWRRTQEADLRYRDRVEERLGRLERKLDLMMDHMGIRPATDARPAPASPPPPTLAAAANR